MLLCGLSRAALTMLSASLMLAALAGVSGSQPAATAATPAITANAASTQTDRPSQAKSDDGGAGTHVTIPNASFEAGTRHWRAGGLATSSPRAGQATQAADR